MVPHWDYLPSPELILSGDTEIPVPDAHAPTSDRLQRRSRSAPAQQNHLAKQQSVNGGSIPIPLRPQRDVDDVTGDQQENPWVTPVYRGERRPDYIVKADEDSFIVLGELERRLRVAPRRLTYWGCE